MTNGISRRGFVATAGVGAIALTTAGCKQAGGSEKAAATPLGAMTGPSVVKMGGLDPAALSYGDLPTGYKPKHGAADEAFKPLYDVLVYIKFSPEMDVISKVCFFDTQGNNFTSMQKRVEDAVVGLRRDIQFKPADVRSIRDFGNFIFKGASNVVIYVDHRNLSYPSAIVPVFFTDKLLAEKGTASKNKSFYDAKVVSNAIDVGGSDVRDIVYLRNYFTEAAPGDLEGDHGEQPIDRNGPGHQYALNIILLAKQRFTPVLLPMILDPDTGNNGTTGAP